MRITIKKKPYLGNAVGATVEVSKRDARVLVAVGLAALELAPVEQEAPAKPQVEKVTDVMRYSRSTSPQVQSALNEPKAPRTYKRRDMKAEG